MRHLFVRGDGTGLIATLMPPKHRDDCGLLEMTKTIITSGKIEPLPTNAAFQVCAGTCPRAQKADGTVHHPSYGGMVQNSEAPPFMGGAE